MKKLIFVAIMAISSSFSYSQSKDVVDIAAGSASHSTLVAAIKAADLVGALKASGPFTVFAPVNEAFDKLPTGTVEALLKPENKAKLSSILTYHVVSGKFDSKAVMAAIEAGNGKAVFTTLNGGKITASMEGNSVKLTDAAGVASTITMVDLVGSNGVIHVIDSVMMPK